MVFTSDLLKDNLIKSKIVDYSKSISIDNLVFEELYFQYNELKGFEKYFDLGVILTLILS